MRTTIDDAGRIVVPKRLRDQVGLSTGEVEVTIDGTAVRIAPVTGSGALERRGRLVLPGGDGLSDEDVRDLRLGDQR